MRRTFKMMVLVAMAIIICSPITGLAAAQKLKFAHVYESSEPFHIWALKAAEEIKAKTNGKYDIGVFPASSLGKEADINEGLSLGTVDLIYTGAAFLGRSYPPISIGGSPYIFRDFDHWKKYYNSDLFKNELAGGYKKATGNTILSVIYYGARHVTANKLISTPADMKGLKIRTPNAPMFMMFPKATGANPTPIAFAEVYLALQSGTVEAQENPLPTIKAKKFYEVQKYINLTGHILNELYVVASPSLWNKLTDEEKVIFTEAFTKASDGATNDILESEKNLVSWFTKQGNIVNADVDVKAMRDATMKMHHKILEDGSAPWTKEIFEKVSAIK